MEITTLLIDNLPEVILMMLVAPFLFLYVQKIRRQRTEIRQQKIDKGRAIRQAKALIEKIKSATYSTASQDEKDTVQAYIQEIDDLAKRFHLKYIVDLRINRSTILKHVHMATGDQHEDEITLALIRQGKFGFDNKSRDSHPSSNNVVAPYGRPSVIPHVPGASITSPFAQKPVQLVAVEEFPDRTVISSIVVDAQSESIYAMVAVDVDDVITSLPEADATPPESNLTESEIIIEDPDTGITIVIDLSQLSTAESDVYVPKSTRTPCTWDEGIATDQFVDDFFEKNIT